MKYVIQLVNETALTVNILDESQSHDSVKIEKGARVVGAGFCGVGRKSVHVWGNSESLSAKPHPADHAILALLFAGMFESQRMVLAAAYLEIPGDDEVDKARE